jgi:hypothetical protein
MFMYYVYLVGQTTRLQNMCDKFTTKVICKPWVTRSTRPSCP